MTRLIVEMTGAAALALAAQVGAVPAGAAPVNRPLADALTRQFNRQELEQMQPGAANAYSGSDRLTAQQPGQPGAIPPAAGSAGSDMPPRPERPFSPD